MKNMQKRGVAGLDFFKGFLIALFVVSVLVFALAILGANLSASTSDATAQAIIANFTTGIGTIGASIPTWITLAGIVVLIAIIVVVLVVVQGINKGQRGGL